MPIYEYQCGDCGHRFEWLARGDHRPQCPSCQGETLEKQFSVFAVGARPMTASPARTAGPCGSCGHPDGPGACSMN